MGTAQPLYLVRTVSSHWGHYNSKEAGRQTGLKLSGIYTCPLHISPTNDSFHYYKFITFLWVSFCNGVIFLIIMLQLCSLVTRQNSYDAENVRLKKSPPYSSIFA